MRGTKLKNDEKVLTSYLMSLENTNNPDKTSCEGCKGSVVRSKAIRKIYRDGAPSELDGLVMVEVEKKAQLII